MKNLKYIFFVVGLAFTLNQALGAPKKKPLPAKKATAAKVVSNTNSDFKAHVYLVEKKIEEDLSAKIKTIFGAGSRISVAVKAIPDETRAEAISNGKLTDVGYIPYPVDLGSRDGANKDSQNTIQIPLKSVEVKLHVAEQLTADEQKHLKKLVEQSLSNLPAKVEIVPIKLASDLIPKAEQSTPPSPMVDKMLTALPFLIGSLLIFLSILFFAKSFAASAKALSDALMSMRIKEDIKQTQEIGTTSEGEVSGVAGGIASTSEKQQNQEEQKIHAESYPHHIALFKRMLRESPISVMQTVKESIHESSSEFSFHFRKLMVRLNEEDLDATKKCLSEEDLESIRNDEVESSPKDHATWLQEFCEQLVVKKVSGGSSLERLIGTEVVREFYAVDPDVLADVAKAMDTQAAWRIASEFLPSETISQLFATGGAQLRNNLITASNVTSDEVLKTIPTMLERIKSIKQTVTLETKEYNDLIVKSLIDELTSRPMDQWDTGVNEFKLLSQEVGNIIAQQFWTPGKLSQVPDQYLAQVIKPLKPEQKAKLVAGFQEPHSSRILGFIPEGQGRTIVEDMISKLRRKNDVDALKEYCVEFLKRLQRDAKEGQFKLGLLVVVNEPVVNDVDEREDKAS